MGERNFNSLLKQGKVTEVKIADWLTSIGFDIQDVSDEQFYKDNDTDLLIHDEFNMPHTLEIKSCEVQCRTHNIFVELGMDRKQGWKKGWFYNCNAELLFYHDNVNNVGQIINWKKMQSEVKSYYKNHKQFWNTTDECWGWGILVPLREARRKEREWILFEYDLNNKELEYGLQVYRSIENILQRKQL